MRGAKYKSTIMLSTRSFDQSSYDDSTAVLRICFVHKLVVCFWVPLK